MRPPLATTTRDSMPWHTSASSQERVPACRPLGEPRITKHTRKDRGCDTSNDVNRASMTKTNGHQPKPKKLAKLAASQFIRNRGWLPSLRLRRHASMSPCVTPTRIRLNICERFIDAKVNNHKLAPNPKSERSE